MYVKRLSYVLYVLITYKLENNVLNNLKKVFLSMDYVSMFSFF